MYPQGEKLWGIGIIVKRKSRMIYLVKEPKMMHKGHSNKTKNRHIDEENTSPMVVESMEVLFNTFDVPIPRKAPETEIEKKTKVKKRYRENRH